MYVCVARTIPNYLGSTAVQCGLLSSQFQDRIMYLASVV